jgi:tetratricopeptide (TPR) repeat protein
VKHKKPEVLLRQNLKIDGDGNVVGNDNTVSVVKLESGDYYTVQIGELRMEFSRDELYQVLAPVRSTSRLMRISLIASVVVILGIAIIWSFQYRQIQKPRQMTGEFNVAVAEIAVVDSDGEPIRSADGKALAEFLTQRLETYFAEIDERSVRYEIWPPDYTGKITGGDLEERARAAESLAQRIKAHIVIYGVVTAQGNHSQFTPEFFVNYKGFEQAQEAIGAHRLGSPMLVPIPFDKTRLQAVENPALAARVKALSLMTIGLAYYSIDDFEEALDYFGQAIATEGWTDTAGKEVAYLLEGNAYVRLASDENTMSYLQLAEDAYSEALNIKFDYTRATLGLSGVVYLESVSDPNNPSFETVDLDGLVEAEQMLLDILDINGLSESVNYEAKINFSLGQIYLVRAQVLEGDWLEKSRARLMQVIQEYEMGNHRIVDLAGHAHARVGLIELLQGNTDKAIHHYAEAIELVTPHYEAHYASILGEIYSSIGETELAIDAYERAIQIAELYGDEEGIHRYSQRLSKIENEVQK